MRIKSEERKQKILEAAAKIFAKHGFDNTSISDITAKVGGSKATIYNYFRSKEEIFVCAAEKFADEHKLNICTSLKDTEKPIEDSLFDFASTLLRFLIRKEIIAAKRMIYSPTTPKEVANFFYNEGPRNTRLLLSEYFKTQIEKGVLKHCDAVMVSRQFSALLVHPFHEKLMLQLEIDLSDSEIDQHIKDTIDIILSYYKT